MSDSYYFYQAGFVLFGLFSCSYKYMKDIVITQTTTNENSVFLQGETFLLIAQLITTGFLDYSIIIERYSLSIDIQYLLAQKLQFYFFSSSFVTLGSYILSTVAIKEFIQQVCFIINLNIQKEDKFLILIPSVDLQNYFMFVIIYSLIFKKQNKLAYYLLSFSLSLLYSLFSSTKNTMSPLSNFYIYMFGIFIGYRYYDMQISEIKTMNQLNRVKYPPTKLYQLLDKIVNKADLVLILLITLTLLLGQWLYLWNNFENYAKLIFSLIQFLLVYTIVSGKAILWEKVSTNYILKYCFGLKSQCCYTGQQLVFQLYTQLQSNAEIGPYNQVIENILLVGLVFNSGILGNLVYLLTYPIRTMYHSKISLYFNKKKQEVMQENYKKHLITSID